MHALQDAMLAHPKDSWLDEFSEIELDSQSELNKTIDMMRAIGAAMVIVPHNYWAWWNGYLSSTGAPDGQTLIGGTTTPIYTKRYWALKKLFTTRPRKTRTSPPRPAEAPSRASITSSCSTTAAKWYHLG